MTLADSIRRELREHAVGMLSALDARPPDTDRVLRHAKGIFAVFLKGWTLAMHREAIVEEPK